MIINHIFNGSGEHRFREAKQYKVILKGNEVLDSCRYDFRNDNETGSSNIWFAFLLLLGREIFRLRRVKNVGYKVFSV